MATKKKRNTPASRPSATEATPRSRSRSATSTASCAASTCTRTSSSARRPSGGFGFCDVVLRLGRAGRLLRQHAGHRLAARLSRRAGAPRPGHRAPRALGRRRAVLPGRVRQRRRHAASRSARARRSSACCSARREAGLRADGRHGVRVVQLRRDAAELGRQEGRGPRADHAGHVRLLAAAHANQNREFFNALMDDMAAFGVPIEGLHTETGPGVYEVAIAFSEALEQADRAILFKTGAKEIGTRFGIMPSFMAKWSQRTTRAARATSTRACRDGKKQPVLRRQEPRTHEQAVRELPRRPGGLPDGVRADVLAHDQQLQAAGRRLLGAGQADLGHGQPHRQLPRRSPAARRRRGWKRAAPAPTSTPTWRWPRSSPPGCTASRRG